MIWFVLVSIMLVLMVGAAIVVAKLDKAFVSPWIRAVERGLRSWGEPTKTHVHRSDDWIYLAKHTRFRVVKYNNQFYTQIKTAGTGWRDFVYKDNRSKWFSTLGEAERAIEAATSDVRLYIDISEYEDPDMYRKVVVASRDVIVKEMR